MLVFIVLHIRFIGVFIYAFVGKLVLMKPETRYFLFLAAISAAQASSQAGAQARKQAFFFS